MNTKEKKVDAAKKPESLYKDEKSINALLRESALSGNALKKSTVLNKGVYPVPYSEIIKGTPIVVTFLTLLGLIIGKKKIEKVVPADNFLVGLSALKSAPIESKIFLLYKKEISVVKDYGNFNRVTSELKGKINSGKILSFRFFSDKGGVKNVVTGERKDSGETIKLEEKIFSAAKELSVRIAAALS